MIGMRDMFEYYVYGLSTDLGETLIIEDTFMIHLGEILIIQDTFMIHSCETLIIQDTFIIQDTMNRKRPLL